MTGNHPILNYDRVRINMRGFSELCVDLTEIDKKNNDSINFPPIIGKFF
jgi:phosphatidylinositol-4,5-bisphosphate 3-kinase catalytic subunit alpha/beta/delta